MSNRNAAYVFALILILFMFGGYYVQHSGKPEIVPADRLSLPSASRTVPTPMPTPPPPQVTVSAPTLFALQETLSATGQNGKSVDSFPATITTGATIRTGPNGHGLLRFPNGAVVDIQSDTTLSLTRYEHGNVRSITTISLSGGVLRISVPPLDGRKGSEFRVETPQGNDWKLAPTTTTNLRISNVGKPKPKFEVQADVTTQKR
jgi:hypothetical protein